MSLDSGFASPTQSGTDPWGGASSGYGAGASAGYSQQGDHNQVTVGNGQGGAEAQAAKDVVKNQGGGQPNSPPPYYPSREELIRDVQTNPSRFNVPPGMQPAAFAQQYFNEFVAKLAGKQPYATDAQGNQQPYDPKQAGQVWTPQERDMLQRWGYNPDVPRGNIVDDNKNSGLYGLRIEPLKGSGAPPIVAFRGTEPGAGPQDLQSDLGGRYVGQSQYEGNLAAINQRLSRPGDRNVDVVGYSLGGALAQKYAVEHAQQVGQLSTFQAPGISSEDAARFRQSNADHHIDVNHFYNDADIVHRAGAAKLDGNFTQVKNPNWGAKDIATLHPHLSSILANSNADFEGAVGANNIHTYTSDPQKDRGAFEGARRLLGPAASGFLGGAYNPIVNGVGGIGQGFSDAKKGGSEVLHGAGDLFRNPLKGLGEIGHGLWDTAKGVGEGFGGAAQIGGGLLAGIGGAGKAVLQQGAGLVQKGWNGAKNLASSAATSIGNGVSNFVHGAQDTISSAGHAIANTASSIKNGVGNALSNTGHAISNGFSSVKKFFHL